MAQQTVTLVSADKKSGRNNKGEWFFHTFVDAGGNKWQTGFNNPLGEKLSDSLGQSVTLEFHEEQRGNFTNHVIDGAEFGGTLNATSVNDGAQALVAQTSGPSSKDESIARAVAFKGVVELVACDAVQADKIVEAVEYYTELLLTGKVAETVRY